MLNINGVRFIREFNLWYIKEGVWSSMVLQKELKKHWDDKHDVVEDMLVYENCKERLFACRTCGKIIIVSDDSKDLKVIEELPIETSNKEVSKHLTWEL